MFCRVYGVLRKRVFWKDSTRQVILVSVLNAFISLATALLTSVEAGKISYLITLTALLSAIVAFCQTFLRYLHEDGSDG